MCPGGGTGGGGFLIGPKIPPFGFFRGVRSRNSRALSFCVDSSLRIRSALGREITLAPLNLRKGAPIRSHSRAHFLARQGMPRRKSTLCQARLDPLPNPAQRDACLTVHRVSTLLCSAPLFTSGAVSFSHPRASPGSAGCRARAAQGQSPEYGGRERYRRKSADCVRAPV